MSISQPPNPFIGYTNEQFAFVGTATDASGKDVTADCDWVWYFTKGKGVSGNPVLYAFAKAGEVTVTATAHLKGDSGAATITGTISAAPPATKMVIAPFMYAKLADGTRVDPGGTLCDLCEVYMELPPMYAPGGFQKKASNSSTWTNMPSGSAGQLQHDGVTWSVYKSTGWSTWGEKNWGIDWRAAYSRMGMPPQPGFATGTWTVFNTIVTSGDGVILFDPDDEALDEATIPWSITHMDYHPTFDVTVSVMTVTGSLVKTLTATAGLGAGSLIWNGSTNAGPTATKGVYTYQVSAVHRWCEAPQMYCQDSDKRLAAAAIAATETRHVTCDLDVPPLLLTVQVPWDVSRACEDCRIAVYSPKGLALKATHYIGDNGHFTGPASGTEEFQFAIAPDEMGAYTAVVFDDQTEAEGQANRDMEPRTNCQLGATRDLWPRAICTVGADVWFPGNIYGVRDRMGVAEPSTGAHYDTTVVPADAHSLLFTEMPSAAVVYINCHANADAIGLNGYSQGNHIFSTGPDNPATNEWSVERRDQNHLARCRFIFVDGCRSFASNGGDPDTSLHTILPQHGGAEAYAGYEDAVQTMQAWTLADGFWTMMIEGHMSVQEAYSYALFRVITTYIVPGGTESFNCTDWSYGLMDPVRYGGGQ